MSGPWAEHIHILLLRTGDKESYILKKKLDMDMTKAVIFKQVKAKWAVEMWTKPKCRSYGLFKNEFGAENHFKCNLHKRKRSLCAQFGSDILPLHIETGHWVGT